ncbi:MAG: UDP-2,3-diacylglucosamine diphosphatase LpxI [Candidatus Omnitrophica bacterium]|nr:UDP-2,3-diacylglucosamine diphosphatase LpxI [Candidatus Omnitrophota bacterium]
MSNKVSDTGRVLGLIAGAGQFPFHVAREARRQGRYLVAVGIQGWADPALAEEVDAYEELAVGQLGRLIERLQAHGVREAIMAGKVTKAVLLDQRHTFDADTREVLRQVSDRSVGALLGAIGQRLGGAGITLLDSSTFLRDALCPAGALTPLEPTASQREDIAVGLRVARALAALDVGQTVVVKDRVVVAVEALEGTDAVIRRAHALAGGGLVVVKTAAPQQDRRFDLPVIGPDTIATLTAAGVSCLALEAGTTILLEREALLASAGAAGICLVGVTGDDPPS